MPTETAIEEKLDKQAELISELTTKLEVFLSRFLAVEKKADQSSKILLGNGKLGLVAQVYILIGIFTIIQTIITPVVTAILLVLAGKFFGLQIP